jgi:quercetin dioxygenase-like cupin family protein
MRLPFPAHAPALAFATLGLLSAMSVAATPPAPKPILGSKVFHFDQLPVRPTPHGERRDVAHHRTPTLEAFECHITTLNPGQASHLPHRHPQEELILVKEGRLEVHLNGQTQVAGPGSVFFYASNDAHAVRNVGDSRATYWVVNLTTPTTHQPARHNRTPTLQSAVFDWSKLAVVPRPTGEGRQILRGSTCTMDSLSCHATSVHGNLAAHGAHRHPDDEIVIVKEGLMEATIEGVAQRPAGPGSIFFFASNELHGMRNAGDTRATYYVIRMITTATPPAPPPEKKKQA